MAVPRVLKCYADDSGDAPDPNCNAVAVAGYVGTVESWEVFERLWRSDVLEVHDAPYLHMKQFTGIVPPFEWDETKRRSFLGAAANAIKGSGLRGVSEVIRLDDLRRFNQDRKFGLDPIALALYGCMLSLNVIYPSSIYEGVTFEVILDKFTKATSKIKKARQYAASAKRDDVSRNMMVTPLMGGLSFKNVLPMQAADFLAYEVLKFNGAKIATWTVGNEAPVRRKSFDILWDAAAVDGSVWDYAWLNQITAYRGGVW